jgi:hypothetical protein
MMGALPVPQRGVPGVLERVGGKARVVGLDLLQADDVGTRFAQPLEKARQAAVDAIDVVRRDLQHVSRLAKPRVMNRFRSDGCLARTFPDSVTKLFRDRSTLSAVE